MAATISLAAALERVLTVPCGRMAAQSVPLAEAHGRVLATDVVSPGPWPATDRSAMDGFALSAAAGVAADTVLSVVGCSLAGHPFAGRVGPGQAVQIMTGAVVPDGADAVVPVEQTSGFDQATVTVKTAIRKGQNVRLLGSEVMAGQRLMSVGQRIRAAEIGALAVLGTTSVPVFSRPVVGILATGDEVVSVGQEPAPHQVRESNSWALAAQVRERGGEPRRLGVARDEAAELRPLLERALGDVDLLLTIGGISRGTHDLVHGMLAEAGVTRVFHGIELKPGKPTWFGVRRAADRDTFVFGLPGNPASCFTVFDLLVAPLLARMTGQDPVPWRAQARLAGASFRPNARLQATPARLSFAADAVALAELMPPSPSGDPFSLLGGNGYALLPPGQGPGDVPRATVVGYAAGIAPE